MEYCLELSKFSICTAYGVFRVRRMSVILTFVLFCTGIVETNARRAFSGTESNQGMSRPSCTKKFITQININVQYHY